MKAVYVEYTNGKDFDRYDAVTNIEVHDSYILVSYLQDINLISGVIITIDPKRIKKIDIFKYTKAEEENVIQTMKNVSVKEHFEGERK
jgi:hypothetical protein|nr:MAG TPA: hypothetical protein [Caudoviricetes sp.]